jgi:hypothetical protein
MQSNKELLLKEEINSKYLWLSNWILKKPLKLSLEKRKRYNYVTVDDLNNAFPVESSQSLILVKSNQDTVIEVPEPMYVCNCLFDRILIE